MNITIKLTRLFSVLILVFTSSAMSENVYLECVEKEYQGGKKYKITLDVPNMVADVTYKGTTTKVRIGIEPEYIKIDAYLDSVWGSGGAGYHGFAINRKTLDMGILAMPSMSLGKCEKIDVEDNVF